MEEKISQEKMVKEAVSKAKSKVSETKECEGAKEEENLFSENGDQKDRKEPVESCLDNEECSDGEEDVGQSEGLQDGSEKPIKEKKKFGRKIKKDKKDEKIEELTDKLTRQMAEFDNFRKRTDKEKNQMYEIGAKEIIDKILPVVDNFERGLAALSEEEKTSSFAEGMEKIYKQFMTTLEEAGVKPIPAVGSEFNPDIHNAVMHVEDEELGENMIAEEFQKGYTYRDSVIRHSMVKVAN